MEEKKIVTIALAGNPNVGKSTVFNGLTGLHQHTGNWPGKTVAGAAGFFTYKDIKFKLVDLPGTYSLIPTSKDEVVAQEFICSSESDLTLIIADATCLERNLNLVLQIISLTSCAILCVNLLDEARKKGISIDLDKLSLLLHIPVVGTSARDKTGLPALRDAIYHSAVKLKDQQRADIPGDFLFLEDMNHTIKYASALYRQCVRTADDETHLFDRKLDKIVTSRIFGFPIMLGLLGLIFWLAITGANYPSALLSQGFGLLGDHLRAFLSKSLVPPILAAALMDGVYTTLTWVISVMLPPMAIFFPLFTLLEDFGYLPRIAFNMDRSFQKCCAHGKQALSMCMGFGCNACGVIGCRIIDSPRERLIAILTNNFVPCNGRFPTLIAIILMFFAGTGGASSLSASVISSLLLTGLIMLGIAATLLTSHLLSKTVLRGLPSSFALELPPYRLPKFGSVILRSMLDRTIFVLGRAVLVATPAGLIIWCFANLKLGDISLLAHCTVLLDPFGNAIGVDGVILMAFLLGFPANEIVMPIIIMTYMAQGHLMEYQSLSQLQLLLVENGWTPLTALCTMILCLMHFPCGTTCLTIKKETGSLKWTALAFAMPTILGISLCFVISAIFRCEPFMAMFHLFQFPC